MKMLKIVKNKLQKLRTNEEGASAVEYAILVGAIGAGLAVAAGLFATELEGVFTRLTTMLTGLAA